jgi:hypothetical protein
MSSIVLLNKTTFTNVATVNIDNVFSTTYPNYVLYLDGISVSANTGVFLRYRAAGSTESGASNYVSQYTISTGSSVVRDRITSSRNFVGDFRGSTTVYVFRPAVAGVTSKIISNGTDTLDNARTISWVGWTTVTTAFDGCQIGGDQQNITGTVRIYGLGT